MADNTISSRIANAKFWVVIPAAGSGSRMQQAIPKQYLEINQMAVIEHTLQIFLANLEVHKLMVCLPAEDTRFDKLLSAKNSKVGSVQGGDSRAQSVLNGLEALDASDQDWVLVHDAARPCLSPLLLERLIEALREDDVGGLLAVRAKDTLKKSTHTNRVVATVDRSDVWQAQTPQMFRYGLLKSALRSSIDQGLEITDEASSIESLGYQPKIIEGDFRNLKITTPDDLELAEFLLRGKQDEFKRSTMET